MRRVAVLLMLVAAAGWGTPQVEAASVQQTQRRLEQILTQLSEQRRRLRLVRRKEQRLLGELEGIDRTKEQAERRLVGLLEEYRQSEVRAAQVAVRLAAAESRLRERRARLGGRLREVYKHGRTGYVEVLLGADDFASFVVRWHLITTIARADADAIGGYAADAARYRQLQATLAQDQAFLKALAAHTATRQREIVAQEQAKRSLLDRVQAERAAYERVVRELQQNSRDLEHLIRRAQRPQGRTPVAAAGSRFTFAWPARGAFTSGFGYRRHPLFGIRHLHTGVDIAAVWGTPVLAAADGRTIYAGWFGGYGKIVVIDHGDGTSTLYGHLSRILVTAGDTVRRGQPVGRVGSTGYSTGPHLHFEIRLNGRPVDPLTF